MKNRNTIITVLLVMIAALLTYIAFFRNRTPQTIIDNQKTQTDTPDAIDWNGPGFYYGFWFGTATAYSTWVGTNYHDHYHNNYNHGGYHSQTPHGGPSGQRAGGGRR